jgi:hypothetical protein
MRRPGTILSQMPSIATPSNIAWLRPTAVPSAMVSRLKRLSSMLLWPWVTPSHMAGDAACHLGRRTDLAGVDLHLFGVAAIGLVGREHVVVGGDDADVEGAATADGGLVALGRRKAVREVGAGERGAVQPLVAFAGDQIEVAAAAGAGAFDDTGRDGFDGGMEGHVTSLTGTSGCRSPGTCLPAGGRSDIWSRRRLSGPFPGLCASRRR